MWALRRSAGLAVLAVAAVLVSMPSASATAPGRNGVIAYDSFPDTQPGAQILTVDPVTLAVTNLSRSTYGDDQASWSPDGQKLLFRHGHDIWSMSATGTHRTNLTHSAAEEAEASYSPDGTKIVYVASVGGQNEIYVVKANGKGRLRLTTSPTDDSDPVWSPDSSQIAFVSNRVQQTSQIFVMNADGSNQHNISNDTSVADSDPDWSPDGAHIAFTSAGRPHLGSVGPDLWTMNTDGTNKVALVHQTSYSDGADPVYSPDGTHLAFVANNGTGGVQVWTCLLDGSGQAQLTSGPGNPGDQRPAWQRLP